MRCFMRRADADGWSGGAHNLPRRRRLGDGTYGAAVWILPPAEELGRRGHEAVFVLPPGPGQLTAELRRRRFIVLGSPFNFSFRTYLSTAACQDCGSGQLGVRADNAQNRAVWSFDNEITACQLADHIEEAISRRSRR